MPGSPATVSLGTPHGFAPDSVTLLVDGDECATAYVNKGLEIRIYRGRELEVQTIARSRALLWGLLARPRDFDVFLQGNRRGSLHRSWLSPLWPDTLTLDDRTYCLPGFGRRHVKELGMHLHWHFWRSTPYLEIDSEDQLSLGMLALAWVWVKHRYVEG